MCVCVCCFVLLTRYWGIVTVLGSIPFGCRPGVAGTSPCTLTTSLAIPVPSSSSSNGPSNYYVDNQGLMPWRLRRLGRSNVRSASLVRVLSDGKISWARGPRVCVILHRPLLKQISTCSVGKKKKKKENPKETHPRWSAVNSLLNRDIDEFRLLWELSV